MVADNTPKWSFKNNNKHIQQKGLEGTVKKLGRCIGQTENDKPLKHQISPLNPTPCAHSIDVETEERGNELSVVTQRITCKAGIRIKCSDLHFGAHFTPPFYTVINPGL